MIKAIIFDYGGILGPDADSWISTYRKVVEKTGLEVDKVANLWDSMESELLVGKKSLKNFSKNCLQFRKTRFQPAN